MIPPPPSSQRSLVVDGAGGQEANVASWRQGCGRVQVGRGGEGVGVSGPNIRSTLKEQADSLLRSQAKVAMACFCAS
jgi:hypothetical protein